MRTHGGLFVIALAVTAVLTMSVGVSARQLSFSEKEFEDVFVLTNKLRFEAAGNIISCPFTALGHYNERLIAKESTTSKGVITHAADATCEGGSLTILNETLPWRIFYTAFRGRLPDITSIREAFVGVGAMVQPTGSTACLVGTTARDPAFVELLIEQSGRGTGARFDESVGIPLGGGFLCSLGGNGRIGGTATLWNLPRTDPITITLI